MPDNLPSTDSLPFLYLALPVMDEPDFLPRILQCLNYQSYKHFRLFVCVNQPDIWWTDDAKKSACLHNTGSLDLLKEFRDIDIVILDQSSPGKGWKGKRRGVGFARKVLMDAINKVAQPDDIIVSLDADTVFSGDYLLSLAFAFYLNPEAVALSVPYFHREVPDEETTRAMLRYEIYMRHYLLNLFRIGSPYLFTALGSAMACRVSAYRAIGGMTPKLSGEDFYFLQKMTKFGLVILWNDKLAYPEARYSDRVFFGTGPAMIKGRDGDWSSYPVYSTNLFDEIRTTYELLPELFGRKSETNVLKWLSEVFGEPDPLDALRRNHRDVDHFIRAFHEKFDGLRLLQFLKSNQAAREDTDESNLLRFISGAYGDEAVKSLDIGWEGFVLNAAPLESLRRIRMFLFEKEMEARFGAAFCQYQ